MQPVNLLLPKPAPRTAPDCGEVQLFGTRLHSVTMGQAVDLIHYWIEQPDGRCRYVVTPNVDHIVMLQRDLALQEAYRDASLILADGWPVVTASRWLGQPLPERVAGSDLVPTLYAAASPQRPLRTFLLGAAPGVAERAAQRIRERWPAVAPVGTYSPPLGFEHDARECDEILHRLAHCQVDLLVVGLGAPKQELWVHRFHQQIPASVVLCVGATIDFLAGEQSRAPRWVQRLGMEWCHRLASNPRRLAARYLRDAWHFPRIVLRQRHASRPQ